MAFSAFFAIKAHSLLKDEQAKDQPRPAILNSITKFMVFALLMTPLALFVEYVRHHMNMDNIGVSQAGFSEELEEIKGKYYAFDKNGDPDSIKVKYAGVEHVLSKEFSTTAFRNNELKLKKDGAQQYVAVKNNNGDEEVIYGFFEEADLKDQLKGIFPATPSTPAKPSDFELKTFFAAGIAYSPANAAAANVKLSPSETRAISQLWAYLDSDGKDVDTREKAIKILVQPGLLSRLDSMSYVKLISLLKDGTTVEPTEANYYLAQVYLSRFRKNKELYPDGLMDYKKSSWKYVKGFHDMNWTSANVRQYAFYRVAVKAFYSEDVLGECNTCLLGNEQLAYLGNQFDA